MATTWASCTQISEVTLKSLEDNKYHLASFWHHYCYILTQSAKLSRSLLQLWKSSPRRKVANLTIVQIYSKSWLFQLKFGWDINSKSFFEDFTPLTDAYVSFGRQWLEILWPNAFHWIDKGDQFVDAIVTYQTWTYEQLIYKFHV